MLITLIYQSSCLTLSLSCSVNGIQFKLAVKPKVDLAVYIVLEKMPVYFNGSTEIMRYNNKILQILITHIQHRKKTKYRLPLFLKLYQFIFDE